MRTPDGKIQEARQVPIAEIWQRLDLEPVKEGRAFSSPFREDKNPSCQLGGPKNIFFDHGSGETLDGLALVQKVLGCSFAEALTFVLGGNGAMVQANRGSGQRQESKTGKAEPAKKFWPDLATAQTAFEALPLAREDAAALELFQKDYGLDPDAIPADWRVYNHPKFGPGIVYPGVNVLGAVSCYKYKSIQRNDKGKRECRFLHGTGGAQAFPTNDPDAPVVFVAGEEKALGANVAGYHGLSSMTGEGSTATSTDWIKYLVDHPRVTILANDNDDAGQKANAATARALEAAGMDPALIRVVSWPDGMKQGGDLNNILLADDVAGLRAFLAAAPAIPAIETPASAPDPKADKESGLGRLSIFSPTQILEAQLPADDCLLGDRILSRGECLLVPGPGGSGKSRLVAQLAADAVQGRPWAGVLETHCPNAKWLFFQTENGMRRLQNDLSAMRRGMSGDAWARFTDQVRFQVPLTDNDRFVSVGDAKTVLRLQAEVKAFDPDVIVFDPLIDFFSGESENDSLAMRETYQLLCRIARAGRPDAAWIIVHHSRTGKAAMRGSTGYDRAAFARGSKALYGAVRGALNLVPGSEDDPDLLLMIPAKNNNGKLPDPAAIRLDPWTMTYAPEPGFDWTAWANSLSDSRPRGGKRDAVLVALSVLGGQWTKYGDLERAIVAASGCSSRTARRYIKNAVSRGVVYEQDGLYSANGKKADTCPDT